MKRRFLRRATVGVIFAVLAAILSVAAVSAQILITGAGSSCKATAAPACNGTINLSTGCAMPMLGGA